MFCPRIILRTFDRGVVVMKKKKSKRDMDMIVGNVILGILLLIVALEFAGCAYIVRTFC